MPSSFAGESRLSQLLSTIGQKRSADEIEAQSAIVKRRKQDKLDCRRKIEIARNQSTYSDAIIKPILEKERVTTTEDLEIVEADKDPEDIDLIDSESNERLTYLRAIPHFGRLWKKTLSLLPQHLFRVVQAGSAGRVVEENGITTFLSQALATTEEPTTSKIDLFPMKDIAHQLKCHISGWRASGSKRIPFASHYISTTDSWEAALNRAERHLCKGDKDITIYVIDTNTLQEPANVQLMYLALKAWNVSDIATWKSDMFRYGSLTEWIFWDKIVARDVDKILYASFARPARGLEAPRGWCHQLPDLVPHVMHAAKHVEGTKAGVPRTVLHATMYHTSQEKKEIEDFDEKVFVGRMSKKLPKAPKSVQEDKRNQIDDQTIENVWDLIGERACRHVLFIWILSLMTKRYYDFSIVEAIVRRHPEAVTRSLEVVREHQVSGDGCTEVLVYCMPGPNCFGRVDVNHYQKMVYECIVRWDLLKRADANHPYHGIDVYLVSGESRPLRNLVRLDEHGLQGGCKSKQVLPDKTFNVERLEYDAVLKYGTKIKHPETDEEHTARIEATYQNKFYAPDGLRNLTSRPRNVIMAQNAAMRSQLATTQPQPVQPVQPSESRLLQSKLRTPPTTGYGGQVMDGKVMDGKVMRKKVVEGEVVESGVVEPEVIGSEVAGSEVVEGEATEWKLVAHGVVGRL
ncbi:hypothetical protein OHC33_005031 [Knufia fluminis]|uniref:DUF7587 domain-containing protein n=1 Tax=Knufia fluminis TaxID=191047 RepID=A0AAN8I484_9EURO|nr:hypothetical protein OHC33_005031 [Knufia fluminis]